MQHEQARLLYQEVHGSFEELCGHLVKRGGRVKLEFREVWY
jgi:hypothetical protein